jgi:hypothetical protein
MERDPHTRARRRWRRPPLLRYNFHRQLFCFGASSWRYCEPPPGPCRQAAVQDEKLCQSGNQGQLSSVQRRVGSAPGSNIAQTTRINCAAPYVLAATLTHAGDDGVSLIVQSHAVVVSGTKLRAGGAGHPRRSRGCLFYCGFTKPLQGSVLS